MRIFRTILAYLLSLLVTGVITFFTVILLAGPHGGILPSGFEKVILIIGWLVVIVVPGVAGYKVWKFNQPGSLSEIK